MLFESITYQDELPFALSFINTGEENRHCHKEIEILLVLRGVTHYRIYHMDYELNPGDLIIADVEDLHQIHHSSSDILLLSLHVDTKYFEIMYPNIRYMFFVCEECMEGPAANRQLLEAKLALLKHRLARLAIDYTQERRDLSQLMEGINDLVSILVKHFQGFFMEDYQYKVSRENLSETDLQRLCSITRYILQNYNRKITLEDVSRSEHLSTYYVSHLIRKTLGFNFQNFVNAIRLEFAEKQLVFSNLTLMQVSQECGFSSPNYFNKCFSAWYGKTPAQYRKEYKPCERSFRDPFSQEEALELLLPYLNVSGSGRETSDRITIHPDFGDKEQEYIDFREHCAPRIRLESLEDLIRLGYQEREIRAIEPGCFLIEEKIMKKNRQMEQGLQRVQERFQIPVIESLKADMEHVAHKNTTSGSMNAAEAFPHIFAGKEVTLSGEKNGLFTAHDLGTPLYWGYRFLADLNRPQIAVHREYALIKSSGEWIAVCFNTSSETVLDVRFVADTLPEQFLLMQTELTERENCSQVLNALNSPGTLPGRIKQQINAASTGRTQFSHVNKRELLQPGLVVYHNTAVILEIASQLRDQKRKKEQDR